MFVDTSGLLCLHHEGELLHAEARHFYEAASRLLTHNYVLDEFVSLANARRAPRELALAFAYDILANPDIEIIWVDRSVHRNGIKLLQARLDKSYSLCDAVGFLLMRQHNIVEALTTDHHFEQEGFQKLL